MLIREAAEAKATKQIGAAPSGETKVVAFMEPPQGALIAKILRHCGLWNPSTPRTPPPEDASVYELDADWQSRPSWQEEPGELTYVDIDEFLGTF